MMKISEGLKNFSVRTLSGLVLLLLVIFLVYSGGWILLFSNILLSVLCFREFSKAALQEDIIISYITYPFIAFFSLLMAFSRFKEALFLILLFLLIILSLYVFLYPGIKISSVFTVFSGFLYTSLPIFIYLTRNLENGLTLSWLIFISSWGSDTSAYLAGSLFGKHKLTPLLSPKKTTEGALGGIIGASLISIIICCIYKGGFLIIFTAAFAAAFSQIGDLAASGIKREHSIKDYGSIIPGHGGFLDRFDSCLFTAPLVYILILFFGL